MNELDELIAEAELGEEARKFLAGNLGQCLTGMAKQDSLEAQHLLLDVNPNDRDKIAELQMKGRLGTMFEQYLSELVYRGNNAMEVFKQTQES